MSRLRVAFIGVLLVPAAARAGDLELGVFAGPAIPTYEQTFQYYPGAFSAPIPLPGASITQQASFGLRAKGGLSLGASLAFYPVGAFGLEARVDSVGVRIDSEGGRYTATFSSSFRPDLSFTGSVDLPAGQVDVARLTPISLGFKLRTPGRVRLFVSAGGSYLPKVEATLTQPLAVQLGRFIPPIEAAIVTVRAEAQPGSGQGHWGVTAGAGIQVALGGRVSLQAEARAFRFPKHTLTWGLGNHVPGNSFEEDIFRSGLAALDPVEWKPTFYQVTAGLALRF
jgi:hypothetical protein